jgi:hypothetical protein
MKRPFSEILRSSRVGSRPKFDYDIPIKNLPVKPVRHIRYSEKHLWKDLSKLIRDHDPDAHVMRLSSDMKAGLPDVWFSIATPSNLVVHGYWELKIGIKKKGRTMNVNFSPAQLKWHESRSGKVSTALVYYEGRLYRIDNWHYTYLYDDLPNIPSVKWPNPTWRYFEKIILNPE